MLNAWIFMMQSGFSVFAALSVSACKSAVRAGGGVGRPGASGRSLRPAAAAQARPPLAGFPAPPGRFSLIF
ncbi:MAG: hypothetical protein NZM15_10745 [Flavobacteriales bacterium]|nr:hypothetical protein [Flavobacteriales bacterium]MDW8433163.1 hypothetical protein [Flavobacteriales bacterium]